MTIILMVLLVFGVLNYSLVAGTLSLAGLRMVVGRWLNSDSLNFVWGFSLCG